MGSRTRLNLDFNAIQQVQPPAETLSTTPGQLQFSPDVSCSVTSNDLVEEAVIGQGNYGGIVTRMFHRQTGNVMAVKRVRANGINADEREKMLRELKIIIEVQNCPDIVRFYGALFQDGDCWICMELLDCSLDKFYKEVYKNNEKLPEKAVGFVTASVVRALSYLKKELNIIHRDVKPSNMLLDRKGYVKLCDFGISGYLVDSIAKTQDVGCQIYMAPERLSERKYGIRSDIWSLGISLVEICIGRFPYVGWNTVFDQLQSVVNGDPPYLRAGDYSVDLCDFVNQCLIKDPQHRPNFDELTNHIFFKTHNRTDIGELAQQRLDFGAYVEKFVENAQKL
ncbi:unnamed protein product [Bursaphelenchus xylophilus]|uniref:mitogen-activated protein kinase kinase n=1 Tax=Bursaphelenchus xylophilus TaxID=6326 RepID=A0A1I7SS26_BURXY|nr:unnamed protein product [Bursaphelenchus xylophilus]CAG9105760.1 unnamed protein product [Bursaphelenchus xylophilus]